MSGVYAGNFIEVLLDVLGLFLAVLVEDLGEVVAVHQRQTFVMVHQGILALHSTMSVLLLERIQIAGGTVVLSWWFNQFILVVSGFNYVQILNLDRLLVLLMPTSLHHVELESIELYCCLVG